MPSEILKIGIPTKKAGRKALNILLVLLISFFFQVFLMEVTVYIAPRFSKKLEMKNFDDPYDEYDPSLARLNSVKRFAGFCDSLYGSVNILPGDSGRYARLVSHTIRNRFQHGYTWYRFGHNYVAAMLAPVFHKNLSAIVVPDDILKYPLAACSQQSIIGMKILMDRGYPVRAVGFYDPIIGGHFCYEVKYEGDWHFYDPNREPIEEILNEYNRPSIKFLNEHPDILVAAYPQNTKEFSLSLYGTYKIGKEGKLPGANARLFQQLTKILSYTAWIFFAVLFLVINRRFFSNKE
jgi:hypothetical protein